MFALSPLAAALQGIGYGSLLTALQGLWAVTTIPDALPIVVGVHAVFKPRRRGRATWLTPYQSVIAAAPPAAEAVADEEEEELELLRCIGAM